MYLSLETALARAKERAGLSGVENDAFLTELLTLSAGQTPEGVTHYRPFYVAARFLQQNLSTQAISEAEGVKFTGQAVPIASLLQMQAAYDASNHLVVPDGFGATVLQTFRLYGSRSHIPAIRP